MRQTNILPLTYYNIFFYKCKDMEHLFSPYNTIYGDRRDEKLARVYNSVDNALSNISKGSRDSIAKNLKDKMHSVKAMEKRFERY